MVRGRGRRVRIDGMEVGEGVYECSDRKACGRDGKVANLIHQLTFERISISWLFICESRSNQSRV